MVIIALFTSKFECAELRLDCGLVKFLAWIDVRIDVFGIIARVEFNSKSKRMPRVQGYLACSVFILTSERH